MRETIEYEENSAVKEPQYVKLYTDCISTVKGLKNGLNPIFLAFLPFMRRADIKGQCGGQIIFVNKGMKKAVAEKVGLSLDSVNRAITDFVKKGLFKRVAVATYQVNPNIIGKGEWNDIKNIRASFNNEVVFDEIKKTDEQEG